LRNFAQDTLFYSWRIVNDSTENIKILNDIKPLVRLLDLFIEIDESQRKDKKNETRS